MTQDAPVPGRGALVRPQWVTRSLIRAAPRVLWAFGDNVARCGFGGQARHARGEANALGVPTKWRPGALEADYFTDADWHNPQVGAVIDMAFFIMESALARGHHVAIPLDGLGTGLAELPRRAPLIHARIEALIEALGPASFSDPSRFGTESAGGT